MKMSDSLRRRLVDKGWNPDRVDWGTCLEGSPGHISIRRPTGDEAVYFSPVTVIWSQDQKQAAIVRCD